MADINVEEILQKLTVDEKVGLLAGVDFWHTKAIPKYGVPALRFSDGPNGVRGTKFFNGVKAACFPCGTALGSTFNLPLLEEAGKKMGEEAKLKGAHVILGPTINMQRSPLGGRGFESLGEDPVLAGLGAAALVSGIQSTGVQATLKHFVCNDQEHKRNAVHSIVTERALREIYTLPFQIAVRHAKTSPGAFMTGYNGVNGAWCSESTKLLEDMLRKEWGWDGLVMSDWYGVYSTTQAVLAGLDIEMPGPTRFRGEALSFNVNTDKVREHILDDRARNVLKLVKKVAAAGIPEHGEEKTGDTPETAALLRRIGAEGTVLLKNDGNVLPLKKDKKTVIIGPNAKVATYHGGGSASLAAYYAVTPFDGISAKLSSPPEYTVGSYSHKMLPLIGSVLTNSNGAPGVSMHVYNQPPGDANREKIETIDLVKTDLLLVDYYNDKLADIWYADIEGTYVADFTGKWDMSLVVSGTAKLFVNDKLVVDNATAQTPGDAFFGTGTIEERGTIDVQKGETYQVKVEFGSAKTSKLHGVSGLALGGGALRVGAAPVIDAQEEIAAAAALAKDADQVILCAGLNADWETEGHDRALMDLPPPMDDLIAKVVEANPNTVVVIQSGTPVTMPWADKVSALVQSWYGGNETGNVIADVLFGDANPSGKLSLSFPKRLQDNPAFLNFRAEASRTLYGEDVYIGYRYYEFADREVLFPFGHGLSYTTFALSGLEVAAPQDGKGTIGVKLTVANTGAVRGAEVAQVYVAPKQAAKVHRPRKELKGFGKIELAPGQSGEVQVDIDAKYAAGYWDEERDKWIVEAGEYEIIVSTSSAVDPAKALTATFKVPTTYWWSGI